MFIEGPQPPGHDLDRSLIGVGGPGRVRGWRGLEGWSGWSVQLARRRGRRELAFCGLKEQPKVFGHVRGGAVPVRRPFRECLLADPFELLGDGVINLAGWARLGGRDLLQDLKVRLTPEWSSPGQQLVEHDAQAKDVGSPIHAVAFAPGLLGAHVGGCASQPGPLAEVLILERQSEVGHAGLA